jgi:hypothetical protein
MGCDAMHVFCLEEKVHHDLALKENNMGMDQYLLIPFLGDEHPFTSYFDVHQGYKVLTHCHMNIYELLFLSMVPSYSIDIDRVYRIGITTGVSPNLAFSSCSP